MNRVSLIAALVLSACATSSETTKKSGPTHVASDFYPLEIGTTWSYEVKLLGSTRQIDVTTTKKNDDGYVEDSTGAQFLVDSFGVRDQKRYLLRNPIAAGTKWTNVVSVSSVENYEILAVDQACESPGGHWEGCVIVESRNRVKEGVILVNEMTFAPGVGIVSLSTVLESEGKQIPQSTLSLLKLTKPAG